MSAQAVSILASEQHMMKATQTGRDYRITVSLPLGYAAPSTENWPFNDMPSKWPVVYVLDGNWYFGMVTDMIRPTAWCGGITDAIVVAIGYEEDPNPVEAIRVSFTRRDHDLTPVPDQVVADGMEQHHKRPVPNGDAAGFHAFIKDDVIPFIENTYRADPANRILVGHSYAGLFGLFSMFDSPGLFAKLILGSPTLSYGEGWMFKREAAFAETNRELPAMVYLFVSELEESIDDKTFTDTLRMAAILKGRNYAGFSLVQKIFADQNHCEVAAVGFQGGLKLALKK